MKKFIALVIIIAVSIGGWITYNQVKDLIGDYVIKNVGEQLTEYIPDNLIIPDQVPNSDNPPTQSPANTIASSSGSNNTVVPKPSATPTPSTTAVPDTSDITQADKDKAVKLAYSRFSAAEIAKYSSMISDGITSSEKALLKSVAYSKFSADEIAYFYKIYNKFYK